MCLLHVILTLWLYPVWSSENPILIDLPIYSFPHWTQKAYILHPSIRYWNQLKIPKVDDKLTKKLFSSSSCQQQSISSLILMRDYQWAMVYAINLRLQSLLGSYYINIIEYFRINQQVLTKYLQKFPQLFNNLIISAIYRNLTKVSNILFL